MTVGFYYAGPAGTDHVRLAQLLIASVRRTMPGVGIVQFTAPASARVPGVDHVEVEPAAPIALARLRAYAQCFGDWLLVDTDVIVQQDVRPIFERESTDPWPWFDVAVADRSGSLRPKEIGSKFMTRMPYNAGAVFSRTAAFWQAAVERLERLSPKAQAWMGDQQAMCDVIAGATFRVRLLPSRYNYSPHRRDEDVSGQAILHFKGPRKAWLLERAA
jgi:hypothetical protein